MTATRQASSRQQTRAHILAAACALFERDGYDATTLRAVAREAQVGLGTVCLHFPTKDALLVAAFEDELGAALGAALAVLPEGSLLGRFLHLGEALYTFYAARPALSRELVRAALFLDQPALTQQVMDFLALLALFAAEAAAQGELRAELDPGEVARALWADYLAVLVAGVREPAPDPAQMTAQLARLLGMRFAGIGGAGRGESAAQDAGGGG